jgi:hypothetical protein
MHGNVTGDPAVELDDPGGQGVGRVQERSKVPGPAPGIAVGLLDGHCDPDALVDVGVHPSANKKARLGTRSYVASVRHLPTLHENTRRSPEHFGTRW